MDPNDPLKIYIIASFGGTTPLDATPDSSPDGTPDGSPRS